MARDEDVVVVNKPAGVPTQASQPEFEDDLVSRLKKHLGLPYLGVHQRLDQETSGVILFAARKQANPGLAEQFEKHRAEKRYVACVEGWKRGNITLTQHLAPDGEGRMRVVARGGQRAITHVRVLERSGSRTLLELSLETGRTHQARVQLAHAGAPIAGDPLYGGPSAPRLLLHARSLSLVHPGTRRKATFEAPVPSVMKMWLAQGDLGTRVYEDADALRAAVALAFERRYGLAHTTDSARATTAFRIINEAGDALPHVALDWYGGFAVLQLYDAMAPEALERLLDVCMMHGCQGIYLKRRPKQANVIVDSRLPEFAPADPVRGTAASSPLAIMESGMPWLVRLGDGLSTGIFLDQRDNRARVREGARGSTVANLFAYTCGFSVAAALGGAKTVSVDVSLAALERGRESMAHAGIDPSAHEFVAEDVFAWLGRQARKGKAFDWVILDPPSYSTTKKRRFSAEEDYAELAALSLGILRPGGRLLASTNHRGIRYEKFRKLVHDALRRANRRAKQMKNLHPPADFRTARGAEPHPKSVLVTLDR